MFGKSSSTPSDAAPPAKTPARPMPADRTLPGFSVIGADVRLTGEIKATADLHIDGEVKGDVDCAALTLGEKGRIEGQVSADRAQIAGAVVGSVEARELVVDATARIDGDVRYELVSIARGGQVKGQMGALVPAANVTPINAAPTAG